MEQTSGGDGEEWKTNEDLVDPAVETSPECRRTAGTWWGAAALVDWRRLGFGARWGLGSAAARAGRGSGAEWD